MSLVPLARHVAGAKASKPERLNRCRIADAVTENKQGDGLSIERKKTISASRFPTWKGGKRTERLRHYFHEDMACLLEVDPDVVFWSAKVEPLSVEYDDGEVREFPHSMWAQTARGTRHISLHYGSRHSGVLPTCQRRPQPVKVRGKQFETYIRAELAAHPRLQTSQDILFHRSRELEPELALRVAAMSAVCLPTTLGDLHRRLGLGAVAWEDVVCLVAQGYIVVDLAYAVGPAMPLISCNPHGHLQ